MVGLKFMNIIVTDHSVFYTQKSSCDRHGCRYFLLLSFQIQKFSSPKRENSVDEPDGPIVLSWKACFTLTGQYRHTGCNDQEKENFQ
jgi:hypothetical protein